MSEIDSTNTEASCRQLLLLPDADALPPATNAAAPATEPTALEIPASTEPTAAAATDSFWQRLKAGFAAELRLQWQWLQRRLGIEAHLRQWFAAAPRQTEAAAAAECEQRETAAPTVDPTPTLVKLQRRFDARREAREHRQQRQHQKQQSASVPAWQPELPLAAAVAAAAAKATAAAAAEAEGVSAADSAAASLPQPEAAADDDSTPALEAAFARQPYELPILELLAAPPPPTAADPTELEQKKHIIQQTLDSFSIDAEVGASTRGPRVTLFEVNPARGVKVESISRIANNLAMDLAAVSLRILTPVPGQDYVGIEVPNRQSEIVFLASLLKSELWQTTRARIPLPLGRNINGADVVLDLAQAPHVLIAGATGSGKSVCLNAMLLSLLYRFTPGEMRLLLIDPKVVEFSVYNRLPHLVLPVITEHSNVVLALRWVIREMERRYRLLAKVGVRNTQSFNSRDCAGETAVDDNGKAIPAKLPLLVVVIDELADIMLAAKGDIETCLARIAQMSRAVGIHTIIATQRPSVNVITGVIKANYPTRIAFQVSSQIDSRTILDGKGAERLLGSGDMLFKPPGAARLQRLQSAMVKDWEIEAVVNHAAHQCDQCFDLSILKNPDSPATATDTATDVVQSSDNDGSEDENLIRDAIDIIAHDRRASTSYLQRRLRIGYNRAAVIMEVLEERGVIGPQLGSAKREILIDAPETQRQDSEQEEEYYQ